MKLMEKNYFWGGLILVVMMVAMAYGNHCMQNWQYSQKYGANARVNYNVFSAHYTGDEY